MEGIAVLKPSAIANAYRLYLRMDDGGSQTVDVANPTFFMDERVEVTTDGRVVRVSGTTLRS